MLNVIAAPTPPRAHLLHHTELDPCVKLRKSNCLARTNSTGQVQWAIHLQVSGAGLSRFSKIEEWKNDKPIKKVKQNNRKIN